MNSLNRQTNYNRKAIYNNINVLAWLPGRGQLGPEKLVPVSPEAGQTPGLKLVLLINPLYKTGRKYYEEIDEKCNFCKSTIWPCNIRNDYCRSSH